MTKDNTEVTPSVNTYLPHDGMEMYIIQLLLFGEGHYDWSVGNVNSSPPIPLEKEEVLISRYPDTLGGKIFNYSVWLESKHPHSAYLLGVDLIRNARITKDELE